MSSEAEAPAPHAPQATPEATPPQFWRAVFLGGLFALGAAGSIISGLKPALLSGYVTFLGYGERLAGYLIAAEVCGAMLGTLYISALGHKRNLWRLAMVSLVVIIAGNALSSLHLHGMVLAALRGITGLGEGVAMGVFAMVLSRHRTPDRMFGLYTVLSLLLASQIYAALPELTRHLSMAGNFTALGTIAVVGLALLLASPVATRTLFTHPAGEPAPAPVPPPALGEGGTADMAASPTSVRPSPAVLLAVLTGTLFYYFSLGGVWPYMGQIGLDRDVSAADISRIFGHAQMWGGVGALVPLFLANRVGRTLPLSVAVLISLGSLLLLWFDAQGADGFTLAACAFMFAWLLFFPYMMGVASALDPSGRISSLIYVLQGLGFLIGPVLCAEALGLGGYPAIIAFGMLCFTIALITLLPVLIRLDLAHRASQPDTR